MENTLTTESANYRVEIGWDNTGRIMRRNYTGLLNKVCDKIKRAIMPHYYRFQVANGKTVIDPRKFEVTIKEDINRIEILDRETGMPNWLIGFLR